MADKREAASLPTVKLTEDNFKALLLRDAATYMYQMEKDPQQLYALFSVHELLYFLRAVARFADKTQTMLAGLNEMVKPSLSAHVPPPSPPPSSPTDS